MIAVLRSQFPSKKTPDRHLFTARYLSADRQERKRREDACALQKLRETGPSPSLISHEVLSECDASSHRFWPTAVLSLTAFEPGLFDDERRLAGSGEEVTEIFAGSGGDFYAYPASIPLQIVLLLRS